MKTIIQLSILLLSFSATAIAGGPNLLDQTWDKAFPQMRRQDNANAQIAVGIAENSLPATAAKKVNAQNAKLANLLTEAEEKGIIFGTQNPSSLELEIATQKKWANFYRGLAGLSSLASIDSGLRLMAAFQHRDAGILPIINYSGAAIDTAYGLIPKQSSGDLYFLLTEKEPESQESAGAQ